MRGAKFVVCDFGALERDQARHVGDVVQGLQGLAFRYSRIFVTQPEVDRKVGANSPVVVGVEVQCNLIAVVRANRIYFVPISRQD